MTKVYPQRNLPGRRALARCKSQGTSGNVSIIDGDKGKTDVVSNAAHQGSKHLAIDTPRHINGDASSKTSSLASIDFTWSEESCEESDSNESAPYFRKGSIPSKSSEFSNHRSCSFRSRFCSDYGYESSTYESPWSEDSTEESDGDEWRELPGKGNSPSLSMENIKERKDSWSRNSSDSESYSQ